MTRLGRISDWMSLVLFLTISGPLSFPVAAQDSRTILVGSAARLEEVVRAARPGNTIVLADGAYDASFTLAAKGTAEHPIVIRAQTLGKAIISQPVRVSGEYLSLVGLRFSGSGAVLIQGHECRMTRCWMSDVRAGKWVTVAAGSRKIEIDHCLFENKEINRRLQKGCQLLQISVLNKREGHHVHHNHFRDIPKGASGNGFETLQLITRGNPKDPARGHCKTIIEDNLFERCNGEAEIISVKSNGNVIRGNTFRACRGSLVLRHGDENIVTGNFFFGDGEADSGGVRMQGTGQVVANNYFHGLGRYGVAMMDGTEDGFYVQIERAKILFNTFVNCKTALLVGVNHSRYPVGRPPKQCVVAGNIFHSPVSGGAGVIVSLVEDDQPEEWEWQDNLTYGELGIPPVNGIRTGNPHLRFLVSGLAVPSKETPATEDIAGEPRGIDVDISGYSRGKRKTLGAVQFRPEMDSLRPLSGELVGPDAAAQ